MNITLNREVIAVVDNAATDGKIVRLTATSIPRALRVGEYGIAQIGDLRGRAFVSFVSMRREVCRGFQITIREGDTKRFVDVVVAWDRNGGKRPAALYADGCEPVPKADRALVEARVAALVDDPIVRP